MEARRREGRTIVKGLCERAEENSEPKKRRIEAGAASRGRAEKTIEKREEQANHGG